MRGQLLSGAGKMTLSPIWREAGGLSAVPNCEVLFPSPAVIRTMTQNKSLKFPRPKRWQKVIVCGSSEGHRCADNHFKLGGEWLGWEVGGVITVPKRGTSIFWGIIQMRNFYSVTKLKYIFFPLSAPIHRCRSTLEIKMNVDFLLFFFYLKTVGDQNDCARAIQLLNQHCQIRTTKRVQSNRSKRVSESAKKEKK